MTTDRVGEIEIPEEAAGKYECDADVRYGVMKIRNFEDKDMSAGIWEMLK